MNLERRRISMKSFIKSRFPSCLLVWMCCDKKFDNRVNHLHQRALSSVYNDNVLTFQKLLEKYNFVTLHERNLKNISNRSA